MWYSDFKPIKSSSNFLFKITLIDIFVSYSLTKPIVGGNNIDKIFVLHDGNIILGRHFPKGQSETLQKAVGN